MNPTGDQIDNMAPDELDALIRSAREPRTLRDAANSRWVLVPSDFDGDGGKLKPEEIVQVTYRFDDSAAVTFFVHESIVMEPELWEGFASKFEREFSAVLPYGGVSFRDMDLNTIDPEDFVSYTNAGIYTISEIDAEIARTGRQSYLVKDYIPTQSIVLTIGDSGMGKSPLQYQLGLCVAAGVPFFGIPVLRGRVLYFDFENSLDQSKALAQDICRVLGLHEIPDNFRIWTPALATGEWDDIVPTNIAVFKPALAIVDTMAKAYPEAEDSNKLANKMLVALKQATSGGTTVSILHHLKKSSTASTGGPAVGGEKYTTATRFDAKAPAATGGMVTAPAADDADIQQLIQDARGASSVYNGADARFLVRRPRTAGPCEVELLGFRRVLGTLPTLYLQRVRDEASGDPIGYARLLRSQVWSKPEYAKIFADLPEAFRWKDLERVFGNAQRSIQAFMQECRSHERVVQIGRREGYRKVEAVREPTNDAKH